jgi:acyl-coenzyme A synthetase/AMP-(fatty) acid ligase
MQGAVASHSTLVMLSEFEPRKYLNVIAKHKVNSLYAVTPMIAMILNEKPLVDTLDLSKVRAVHMASAPLSRKLLDDAKRYFPNAWITNSYGSTETGPRVFGGHPDSIATPELSVGYPIPEIPIRLVDGVLQVKSPGMMVKYNNRQDLYDKSVTDDGYFITNDLFTVDEQGFYYFAGRSDDMFKSGGNTVYPSKIEEVLESNSKVVSACVLGIDDDIKGKKPYAFIIPKSDDVPSEDELKQHVLNNCPAYMHPREIWFLDVFPLTGPNKIDKKLLLKLALAKLSTSA